ncbi:hypothetical protein [Agriterribacter humi]|uniref:hypothetical protein n=1 Tax=Agriterribacter humi TaxID=1104781 RepID=UPI00126463DA|nr:hypothetical protein [Agriterribacter humi]
MKKIIFLCFISIIASTGTFAISGPGAPEKIKELFYHEFPQIKNPVFFDSGDSYEVFFKKDNNVTERVFLNLNGEITRTIEYYKENALEPFIREKINKKYQGKTIFGISEVRSNSEHFYRIVLQDNKNWFIVKSNATGSTVIERKLDKK